MASNTENLNLLMKNPSTDGADTFNVQTMLNDNWQKIDNNAGTVAQTLANILKPTTPPLIGLPPSTTPDGMFQALGNTGELHVWRKTVVIGSPVSAYFSLGDTIELTDPIIYLGDDREASAYFEFSNKALTVRDNGTVDNNDDAFANVRFTRYVDNDNKTFYPHNNASHEVYLSSFRGRYVRFYAVSPYFNAPSSVEFGVWYYVPADATTDISRSSQTIRNNGIIISKLQKVIGHPYKPAGTTTTYPVSTNPNAYQEGDDAKPAGYTLGEVVMGSFSIPASSSQGVILFHADTGAISVSTDGILSIGTLGISMTTNDTLPASLKGQFVQVHPAYRQYASAPFNNGGVYYLPSDAVFSGSRTDRYQPVTGYAAIPAGTTIEYLGKLGDKARVQVVSYVGTGTYGSDHPNSLTFDFVPKVVMFIDYVYTDGTNRGNHYIDNYSKFYYEMSRLSTEKLTGAYTKNNGFGGYGPELYGKKTNGGKTITWYSQSRSDYQANSAGYIYTYLGIG